MKHVSKRYQLPIYAESWNVAFRKRSMNGLSDYESVFSVIPNPFRYWAADPFVFEYGNEVYIFAELYDYIKRRGVIGYYKIGDGNKKWIPVIQEPYHLSFPFIFSDSGQIYILPESSQSSTVYLYRAVSFPDKWEKSEVFFRNVRYVDTTPFCAFEKNLALTYDLQLPALRILNFTEGQDLIAESTSPELRRPAGFISPETGIRVAQNCAEDYGKGLIFYQFELGEDLSYREKELCRVSADQLHLSRKLYLDGLHTYNCSENYEVVDIKTRRFNFLNLLMRLASKLKRWRK